VKDFTDQQDIDKYINLRLRRSKSLLKKVNAEFDPEVIDSPQVQLAEKLLRELLALDLAIPSECLLDFQQAVQNSWYALWKAKNYSTSGWAVRLNRDHTGVSSELRQYIIDGLRRHSIRHDGVDWPYTHQPPFDEAGNLRAFQRIEFPATLNDYLVHSGVGLEVLAEGAIVGWSGALDHLPDHVPLYCAAIFSSLPKRKSGHEGLNFCLISGAEVFRSKLNGIQNSVSFSETIVRVDSGEISTDSFEGSLFLGGLVLNSLTLHGDEVEGVSFLSACNVVGTLTLRSVQVVDRLTIPKHRNFSGLNIVGAQSEFDLRVLEGAKGASAISVQVVSKEGQQGGIRHFSAGGSVIESLVLKDFPFSGDVDLRQARVVGHCSIVGSSFSASLQCEGATFGTEDDESGAFEMVDCEFLPQRRAGSEGSEPALNFQNVNFYGKAGFLGNRFMMSVDFAGAKFHRKVSFEGTTFEGYTNFGSSEGRPASFMSDADFSFPKLEDSSSTGPITFLRAEFNSSVDFSNRKFDNLTEFESVDFSSAPKFHGATFHQNVSFRNSRFRWRRSRPLHPLRIALEYRLKVWGGKVWHWVSNLWKNHKAAYGLPAGLEKHNRYCKETTSSFRTLRQAMQSNDDTRQAAIFHREELRARHSRFGDREISRFEVWVGGIYSLVSDYGESVARPLVIMLASLAMSACSLALLSGGGMKFLRPAVGNAIEIQFRPFYHLNPTFGRAEAMGVEDPCSDDISAAIHSGNSTGISTYCFSIMAIRRNEAGFKATVIAQSLVTIMCLFLVLLGVRRKLQM